MRHKKYYGGDENDIHTSFGTFEAMIKALNELVDTYDAYYKDSILASVLAQINNAAPIPEILKPLLHLELKPSNLIELLKYYLDIEKTDSDNNTSFNTLLPDIVTDENLLKFMNINRTGTTTDLITEKYGWHLTTLLLDTLFKSIGFIDLTNHYNIETNFIICGMLDHINVLNGGIIRHKGGKKKIKTQSGGSYSVNDFYDGIFDMPEPEENINDALNKINVIKDFFDKEKNPKGFLPPIVLLLLSCRINPAINAKDSTAAMSSHRNKITDTMISLEFCCNQTTACTYTGDKCTIAKEMKKEKSKTVENLETVEKSLTTCDSAEIPTKTISRIIKFLNGKEIEARICPSLCGPITWKTFDPIFKIFTNVTTLITERDVFQQFLFDTIIPYSTFLPLNINAYFNEVVYKKKDLLYDEKIAFFESSLLTEYKEDKENKYTNPLCVPNEIMQNIHRAWEEQKKYIKKATSSRKAPSSASKAPSSASRFKSFFSFRKNKTKNTGLNTIMEADDKKASHGSQQSVYSLAREEIEENV
jgi:hypothetical protein